MPDHIATSSAVMNTYLQCVDMPPLCALSVLSTISRDLLRRSAELPESEQGLLAVLTEYRYAVYAFVTAADAMCS